MKVYTLKYTSQFKRSLKRCVKRGLNIVLLTEVLEQLQMTGKLPEKYNPHKLSGTYKGCWECHLSPDWLLIWQQDDTQLILILVDTGSHSDLF